MALFGPKRIGVALGSGGARGLAHIGVLKVLESEGLRPDVITGTSMGALVGAFYAAGVPIEEMERIALEFDPKSVMKVSEVALNKGAVYSGEGVLAFLRRHLPETFDDLLIPYGCVATDITHNKPVRFTSGDLACAVRASVSVPVAFLPVRADGALLIDGYACEPVPVDFARQLGGEIILGVEVCGSGRLGEPAEDGSSGVLNLREIFENMRNGTSRRRGTNVVDLVSATSEALEGRLASYQLRSAHIVVSPDVHDLGGFDYSQAAFAIAEGERAMAAEVDALRRKARRR